VEGKFLRFVKRNNYEFVERTRGDGIVIILAVTDQNELIFIEQYREPVQTTVIEFPAGLINDQKSKKRETFKAAAKRELLEEAGYTAKRIQGIFEGPVSSGLANDMSIICKALDIKKVTAGGGDHTESIEVHKVKLSKTDQWLSAKIKKGILIDPKVYACLYFLKQHKTFKIR